jgi:hypothetical protein
VSLNRAVAPGRCDRKFDRFQITAERAYELSHKTESGSGDRLDPGSQPLRASPSHHGSKLENEPAQFVSLGAKAQERCCASERPELTDRRYRRVLLAALVINGTMFLIEIAAGLMAGSVALQADALDFLGDVANYGISLFVIGMALRYRAKAALIKGATMGLFHPR